MADVLGKPQLSGIVRPRLSSGMCQTSTPCIHLPRATKQPENWSRALGTTGGVPADRWHTQLAESVGGLPVGDFHGCTAFTSLA